MAFPPTVETWPRFLALADSIEANLGVSVPTVSGGNSANLEWVLSGAETGRINHLRLGAALLLGREPLHRQVIKELHTDAITLKAEVIESKRKPTQPWGEIAQSAFGEVSPTYDKEASPRPFLPLAVRMSISQVSILHQE